MKTKVKPAAPMAPLADDRQIPVRSMDTLSRRNSDGNTAVLNLHQDDRYYVLDSIAAEFWELIDGKRSVHRIKSILQRKHQPPLSQFNKDVTKLLESLKKRGLIRISEFA